MFYAKDFSGEVQGGFIGAVVHAMQHSLFNEAPAVVDAIARGRGVLEKYKVEPMGFYPTRETMGRILEPLEARLYRGTLQRVGSQMFPTQITLIPDLLEQTGAKCGSDIMQMMGDLYAAANRGHGVGKLQTTVHDWGLEVEETTPYDCAFHEGLFVGVARHFHEVWNVRQTSCRHQGAAACVYEIPLIAQ